MVPPQVWLYHTARMIGIATLHHGTNKCIQPFGNLKKNATSEASRRFTEQVAHCLLMMPELDQVLFILQLHPDRF